MTAHSDATLDPADWDEFRALAHRMVDDSIEFLRTLPERRAWQPVPDDVRKALTAEGVPRAPQGDAPVYAEFLARVLPYTNGSRSPRFFGWVQGNGTPLGMMADMLASGMNAHMAGFNDTPRLIEERVIAWLAELMGFPAGSGGLLMSGGTMANYVGLAVARHAKAGYDVRAMGALGGPRLTVYASREIHSWGQKCCELLGLGNASLRLVPVDAAMRVDVEAMRAMIAADRAADERLWYHVDGAFGALARLSPTLAPIVRGMERADSLALDLHKWGFLPFEIACVLVRNAEAQRAAFSLTPSYLRDEGRGVIAGGLAFADRGPELTRGFKALKAWMSFKAHGSTLRNHGVPGIELCAPVALNIAVWRWVSAGFSDEQCDALNRELLLRIQESGLAVPSGSLMRGRYVIRTCITNHRTRWADLERFADGIAPLAVAIERAMRG